MAASVVGRRASAREALSIPPSESLVRKGGLEPPHLSAPEPKSGASTNSATFAGFFPPLHVNYTVFSLPRLPYYTWPWQNTVSPRTVVLSGPIKYK